MTTTIMAQVLRQAAFGNLIHFSALSEAQAGREGQTDGDIDDHDEKGNRPFHINSITLHFLNLIT